MFASSLLRFKKNQHLRGTRPHPAQRSHNKTKPQTPTRKPEQARDTRDKGHHTQPKRRHIIQKATTSESHDHAARVANAQALPPSTKHTKMRKRKNKQRAHVPQTVLEHHICQDQPGRSRDSNLTEAAIQTWRTQNTTN